MIGRPSFRIWTCAVLLAALGMMAGHAGGFAAGVSRPIVLREPFDVLPRHDGSILIADRTSNAIYRLIHGKLTLWTHVALPRDLESAPHGRVWIASGPSVIALNVATHRTSRIAIAREDILGILRAPDGSAVVSENGTRIVRLGRGRREVLASGLDGVHGLLWTRDGILLCEAYTGRVLLLRADGTIATLASGLSNPSYASPAPGGGFYISEYGANRFSYLSPSGAVSSLASIDQPAGMSRDSARNILVASLSGAVFKVNVKNGRVHNLLAEGPRAVG